MGNLGMTLRNKGRISSKGGDGVPNKETYGFSKNVTSAQVFQANSQGVRQGKSKVVYCTNPANSQTAIDAKLHTIATDVNFGD
jgi:hypothetical protein